MSVLGQLLKSHPNGLTAKQGDDGWNYSVLSSNPSLCPEYVRNNLDKNWNVVELLSNPNMDLDLRLILLRRHVERLDSDGSIPEELSGSDSELYSDNYKEYLKDPYEYIQYKRGDEVDDIKRFTDFDSWMKSRQPPDNVEQFRRELESLQAIEGERKIDPDRFRRACNHILSQYNNVMRDLAPKLIGKMSVDQNPNWMSIHQVASELDNNINQSEAYDNNEAEFREIMGDYSPKVDWLNIIDSVYSPSSLKDISDLDDLDCDGYLPGEDEDTDNVSGSGYSLQSIIIDDEIIEMMLNEPKLEHHVELLGGNPRLTVTQLGRLFYQHRDRIDWSHAQSRCSMENLKWIINNSDYTDIIDCEQISWNWEVDEETIDWLFNKNDKDLMIRLSYTGKLQHRHMMKLWNKYGDDIEDAEILLNNCQYPDITRLILQAYPELMDGITLHSAIHIGIDREMIEELINRGDISHANLLYNQNGNIQDIIDHIIQCRRNGSTYPPITDVLLRKEIIIDCCLIELWTDAGLEVELISPILLNDTIMDLLKNNSIKAKFEVRRHNPTLIIEVNDLETLKSISKLINRKCKIKCKAGLEEIELIFNDHEIIKLIDWKSLSLTAHQDLIISYPSLPWNIRALSSRDYYLDEKSAHLKSASTK